MYEDAGAGIRRSDISQTPVSQAIGQRNKTQTHKCPLSAAYRARAIRYAVAGAPDVSERACDDKPITHRATIGVALVAL